MKERSHKPTQTEPALVHVHSEGGDESEAQVVAERPGVGVGAKVPADQGAVDSGVRQHRLRARVKVVDVDRTAVFLQVQRPERCQDTRQARHVKQNINYNKSHSNCVVVNEREPHLSVIFNPTNSLCS